MTGERRRIQLSCNCKRAGDWQGAHAVFMKERGGGNPEYREDYLKAIASALLV